MNQTQLPNAGSPTPDFVTVERLLHQRLLWEQSESLGRIELARKDFTSAVHDALPAANTSVLLGAVLFLAAYSVRPIPCIVLPGRGAFGIPAKRKRKH
jgi:hypothetical protein